VNDIFLTCIDKPQLSWRSAGQRTFSS